MRTAVLLLALVAAASAACHPGPAIGGPKLTVGGTIAGIVSTDTNAPVVGRTVTAIEKQSGQRFEATTGANGGFTIKVPQGTYRLEVTLVAGEAVTKQPGETRIDNSDLDPKRDFVISTRRE